MYYQKSMKFVKMLLYFSIFFAIIATLMSLIPDSKNGNSEIMDMLKSQEMLEQNGFAIDENGQKIENNADINMKNDNEYQNYNQNEENQQNYNNQQEFDRVEYQQIQNETNEVTENNFEDNQQSQDVQNLNQEVNQEIPQENLEAEQNENSSPQF